LWFVYIDHPDDMASAREREDGSRRERQRRGEDGRGWESEKRVERE
jgi:hypothetical protein